MNQIYGPLIVITLVVLRSFSFSDEMKGMHNFENFANGNFYDAEKG